MMSDNSSRLPIDWNVWNVLVIIVTCYFLLEMKKAPDWRPLCLIGCGLYPTFWIRASSASAAESSEPVVRSRFAASSYLFAFGWFCLLGPGGVGDIAFSILFLTSGAFAFAL